MSVVCDISISADGYSAVVARLNERWRVIVCRDAIQWILQSFDGLRNGRAEWRGVGYFRARDALIRASGASAGEIEPSAFAILHALPAHIEGGRS